ncbi:hypothetical protein L195_g031236, partial [Trifolium pratense]
MLKASVQNGKRTMLSVLLCRGCLTFPFVPVVLQNFGKKERRERKDPSGFKDHVPDLAVLGQ